MYLFSANFYTKEFIYGDDFHSFIIQDHYYEMCTGPDSLKRFYGPSITVYRVSHKYCMGGGGVFIHDFVI